MVSVPLSRHLILGPLTLASLGLASPPEGDHLNSSSGFWEDLRHPMFLFLHLEKGITVYLLLELWRTHNLHIYGTSHHVNR